MRKASYIPIFFLVFIFSCTPTVRQVVVPKSSNQINYVKKGSYYFTEEEEKILQNEAQALGIPIPDRSEIANFVNYYLSNKRNFELTLQRANFYMPIILPIVRQHGLPDELALLPVIESGFNNFAVSRAGAAGLWQFMPSTARRYGLRVDKFLDERFDVLKSTDAAMRYLKDLYAMFGNWELALASYNCGENCVARRTGGVDFWLTKSSLPLETRNYVPAFFAVLLLASNPEKYGISVKVDGISVASVVVDENMPAEELIQKKGINESVFRDLNPHIRSGLIPAGTLVYLPRSEELKEEKVQTLPNGAKLIIR